MNRDIGLPNEYLALRDYLKINFRGKPAAGGKECVIRCPFCGDSSDPHSAHMYVGINKKRRDVISYNCFRCNASGDVGRQFFNVLGISDQDIVMPVLEYNASKGSDIFAQMRRHNGFVAGTRRGPTTTNSIIPIFDTEEYHKKLDYINRRIGGQLTLYDLVPYRIVLNLRDYLSANGITSVSRDPRIIDELAFGFLGFLSVDSTHITMRRLVPENKVHPSIQKRYVNYTITDAGVQIYCIREAIDPTQPNIVIICEGGFDALSIHYNLLYPFMNKVIFAACGKGIMSVIEYLVTRKGMEFFNTTFHIFIDNDLLPAEITSIRRLFRDFHLTCIFHRNSYPGEKDFGVPGTNIIDYAF